MNRIQIIEDDFDIAEGIKYHLEKWGFEVFITEDLNNIIGEFEKVNPQLILLDILLPFYDGFYWCNKIREISSVPIIFISSITDNMNIVMAMNMGGDDFIVKPFDLNVLTAKINAIFRRMNLNNVVQSELKHNGVILNLENQNLYFNNRKLELSKNEFKILYILLSNIGKVVSREMLMEKLWNSDSFIDENTLTVNVNRLRRKLNTINLDSFIKTKFGVGYIIE